MRPPHERIMVSARMSESCTPWDSRAPGQASLSRMGVSCYRPHERIMAINIRMSYHAIAPMS